MLTNLIHNVFNQLLNEREKYNEKIQILYIYFKSTDFLRNKENNIIIVLDLRLKFINFNIKFDQFFMNQMFEIEDLK